MEKIDRRRDVLVLADGHVQRDDADAVGLAQLLQHLLEIRVLSIKAADDHDPRRLVRVELRPDELRADLDPRRRVDDHERRVRHAQRRVLVAGEVEETGSVEEVDLDTFMRERGKRDVDGDAALLFFRICVEDARRVIYLAEPVRGADGVEQALDEGRFPRSAVPHDRNIADLLGMYDGQIRSPLRVSIDSIRAMSGHSKWSTIKRQKGAADVKRGIVFTKVTREIMLAAREGGGDPESNFRLRLAIDRARAVNMPHANIDRAIDRATGGGDGARLESVVYEGYAPGGVSIMVEAATDNRNRTASEVRATFTRSGGKLGDSGSVQWIFEQKGVIEIGASKRSTDEISLMAIDAGAEDVEVDGSLVIVYTTPSAFEQVKTSLEKAGVTAASAEISMRPTTTVRVEGDQARKVLRLVEELEDLDDVQKVHANFDVPEEVLQHA